MQRSRKPLRYISLAAVIFFTVSGGPYGLEPLLFYGKNLALLLLIIIPVCWDIPSILMVFEMNSFMPVNGGYYQWVKRALGIRWAFYEGWWTWLYTFVDLAVYPVLFVEYLGYFFPAIVAYKIPVCLLLIWTGAGINILGLQPLGKTSLVLSALVLLPFLMLFVTSGTPSMSIQPLVASPGSSSGLSTIGLAMYTVMWNFIGWDNATTYAGEVDRPARSYIISTLIAFVSIIVVYFGAVLTAQHSGMDMRILNEQGFPALGERVGGRWLAIALAAGGMASSFGIYLAVLLSVSRVPKAMSDDRLLPAVLHKLHPRYKTPYVSICLFAIVASLLVLFSFIDLLLLDVTLYGAGLMLEFISLIVLRIKLPHEPRPFKIPLGVRGLIVLFIFPFAILVTALTTSVMAEGITAAPVLITAGSLLSAELAWQLLKRFRLNNDG